MYIFIGTGFPKRILTEEHCSSNGPSGETGGNRVFHANPHRKTGFTKRIIRGKRSLPCGFSKEKKFTHDPAGETRVSGFALRNLSGKQGLPCKSSRKTGFTQQIIRGKQSLPCRFSRANRVYPRSVRRNTPYRICLSQSQGNQGLPWKSSRKNWAYNAG